MWVEVAAAAACTALGKKERCVSLGVDLDTLNDGDSFPAAQLHPRPQALSATSLLDTQQKENK